MSTSNYGHVRFASLYHTSGLEVLILLWLWKPFQFRCINHVLNIFKAHIKNLKPVNASKVKGLNLRSSAGINNTVDYENANFWSRRIHFSWLFILLSLLSVVLCSVLASLLKGLLYWQGRCVWSFLLRKFIMRAMFVVWEIRCLVKCVSDYGALLNSF